MCLTSVVSYEVVLDLDEQLLILNYYMDSILWNSRLNDNNETLFFVRYLLQQEKKLNMKHQKTKNILKSRTCVCIDTVALEKNVKFLKVLVKLFVFAKDIVSQ